jgi:hypothetical protein
VVAFALPVGLVLVTPACTTLLEAVALELWLPF